MSDRHHGTGRTMTLPPLPYVAHRILLATLDERTQAQELAEMLRDEPGLAARTLAAANAAWFAGQPPIDDLPTAVVRLGLQRLRVLATGLLVAPVFNPQRCAHFDTARFWRHAVATGFAASQLARNARPPVPDTVPGLAGLLRNIGLLLLATAFPVETAAALDPTLPDADAPLAQRLDDRLGTDHHRAGVMLLEAWDLPAAVVAAVDDSMRDPQAAEAPVPATILAAHAWAAEAFEPDWVPAGGLPREVFAASRRACRQEWERLEKTGALMAGKAA